VSDAGDPYVYPGTSILRNRLGITDPDFLDKQERVLVALRIRRNVPRGNFDLKHLRAIHRHLFQDIYEGRRAAHGRDQQGPPAIPVP
jgi:cell filamentation protein